MLTTRLSRRDWFKVSAAGVAGVLGTMAPLGFPGIVLGHDQMKMPGLDFSMADVRIGNALGIHPRTGQVTTQNERRAMIETRLHVGLWRGIGAVQRMADVSPADLQPTLQNLQRLATVFAHQGQSKYNENSVRGIRKSGRYFVRPVGYPWAKPLFGLRILRQAVTLDPALSEKHVAPDLLSLLSVKIEKGVVSDLTAQADSKSKSKETKSKAKGGGDSDRPGSDANLGTVHPDMKFRPLTAEMLAILNEIERSHDDWIKAAKDKSSADELALLVSKHHRQHSQLEHMARDHDELTLLALQHHVHDIDRQRPKAEIDKLLDASNRAHQEWVKAVKDRDFPSQWRTGLNHARFHVMLGVNGITLHEIGA